MRDELQISRISDNRLEEELSKRNLQLFQGKVYPITMTQITLLKDFKQILKDELEISRISTKRLNDEIENRGYVLEGNILYIPIESDDEEISDEDEEEISDEEIEEQITPQPVQNPFSSHVEPLTHLPKKGDVYWIFDHGQGTPVLGEVMGVHVMVDLCVGNKYFCLPHNEIFDAKKDVNSSVNKSYFTSNKELQEQRDALMKEIEELKSQRIELLSNLFT